MQERIEAYRVKGYEILNSFVNEYILMYRFGDCAKVRLYYNGQTIEGY